MLCSSFCPSETVANPIHKEMREREGKEERDIINKYVVHGNVITVEPLYCRHLWGSYKCPD